MTELRWITRRIDYTGISQGHAPDIERVLQFREGGYETADSVSGKLEWRGSNWHDVPELSDISRNPDSRGDSREPQRGSE